MKPKLYYEIRTMPAFGPTTPIASDIARHLQSRQYLGLTIVVCQNPLSMLSATRKQWLRLARNLQKQRASTLNAEDILRFTHTIMHMQHLQFVAKPPENPTEAHIFFVHPDDLPNLPQGCLSLYIIAPPRATQLKAWVEQLAEDALIVDYKDTLELAQLGLQPKKNMELRMLRDWRRLERFMKDCGVDPGALATNTGFKTSAAIDEALDKLLAASNEFLRLSASFQHVLSLAQPLSTTDAAVRKKFEITMRLAHRVQALTPGAFGNYLLKNFGDKSAGSFFLRDAAPEHDELLEEDSEEVSYHDMDKVPLTTETA